MINKTVHKTDKTSPTNELNDTLYKHFIFNGI